MENATEQKYVGNLDEVFPIINPSKLIGHKLLNHKPKSERQKTLMTEIKKCINIKFPAFRVPCMDPSEENGEIVFKPGNVPAIGYSAIWWDETWKNFMPSKNSQSGTNYHYAIFLGTIIKYLIDEKKYSVAAAWEAVCDDSCVLGHYCNSEDAKKKFEPTGSRNVGAFCDLANTCKILKKRGTCRFFLAGGNYGNFSYDYPLADMFTIGNLDSELNYSVGWLVLDV